MEVLNLATKEKQDEILSNFPINVSNRKIFIENGLFTVPDDVEAIYVTVCGGGGGGGAACIIRNLYKVTPGQIINITVGKGGAG